jgi:Ca2+-binding EF-hand superfamily protein
LNGCIDFKEFVAIMSGGYEPDEITIAKNMFYDYDKDKDGYISFEEFKQMAKYFFVETDEEKLKKDFERIDLNSDGKLSIEGLRE